MSKTTDYETLELSNDFIFAKVMQNKELCRQLLELIMGIPIADISYPEEQKTIDISMDAKSVRLDVYAADDRHTVYDVEMQTGRKEHLPKRSRYYQGMIDLGLLEKGTPYRELNPSYVIFICTFDPFGEGRHVYSFENRCLQDQGLRLGDEAVKIFLNANGVREDVSGEMKAFLNYLSKRTVESPFVERLDREVQRVKENKKWRREYMTLQMKLDEVYEEAKEAGWEAGLAEGRKAGLAEGREAGLTEGRKAGLAEGLEEGREEGREQGRTEGRERVLLLMKKMAEHGEQELVIKLTEPAFLEEMFRKYQI